MDTVVINIDNMDNSSSPGSCGQYALTSSYGWLIQGILAFLVFSLLVVKRFCEPFEHRRSWLVWFYDTSKQGFGSIIVHFANVFLAEHFIGDPCTWYIISFLLDSTIGLAIVWAGVQISIYIGRVKGLPTLLFGEYGRPPSIHAWLHQCVVYILIMLVVKIVVTLLMEIPIWSGVRDLILSPFPDPKVKVVVAVVIIPLFVNALIFWVTDNFLMLKYKQSESRRSSPVVSTSFSQDRSTDNVNSKICFRAKKLAAASVLGATSDPECDVLLAGSPTSSNDDDLLDIREERGRVAKAV